MAIDKTTRNRKPEAVRADIESALAGDLTDLALRDRLEELALSAAFDGFTWLWGPELYRRNRIVFRPFILAHFSIWLVKPSGSLVRTAWSGDAGTKLDAWLKEVDAADDVQLFRRLYPWKYVAGRSQALDLKRWRADLCQRFRAAATSAARATVLDKFDCGGSLDEASALDLYDVDPQAAAPFIARLVEFSWIEKRQLWRRLFDAARIRNDEEFAFRLYRRQIPQKEWETDIFTLAERIKSPLELCAELDRRHPEDWSIQPGMTLFHLVEKRGRDVLPYVQKHLRTVYRSWWGGRDGYSGLVKLAASREWWDLWSALVRTCATHEEFDAEVNRLLKEEPRAGNDPPARLLLLTGVSREWNFGPFGLSQVQQLEDATAVRMYERFPDLVRGPFRMNVSAGGTFHTLTKLTEAALAADDTDLVDYLASRIVTRAVYGGGWQTEHVETMELLSRYYERFRDDALEFSRRAVNVLEQVPAYAIGNYNDLIRTNRLARLFYERSASRYLAYPQGIRDLLESPQIHSQALAFRVLGLDSAEARNLAAAHLDLLQATLLRPLHRKTRMLALRALENGADSIESAREIHHRCRQALRLPDQHYPKEQLIGLIGRLLRRWPELASPRERPVVYGAPV